MDLSVHVPVYTLACTYFYSLIVCSTSKCCVNFNIKYEYEFRISSIAVNVQTDTQTQAKTMPVSQSIAGVGLQVMKRLTNCEL